VDGEVGTPVQMSGEEVTAGDPGAEVPIMGRGQRI
jgi:hypothetical protein